MRRGRPLMICRLSCFIPSFPHLPARQTAVPRRTGRHPAVAAESGLPAVHRPIDCILRRRPPPSGGISAARQPDHNPCKSFLCIITQVCSVCRGGYPASGAKSAQNSSVAFVGSVAFSAWLRFIPPSRSWPGCGVCPRPGPWRSSRSRPAAAAESPTGWWQNAGRCGAHRR